MSQKITELIAGDLKIRPVKVQNTIDLLTGGPPFPLLPATGKNLLEALMKSQFSKSGICMRIYRVGETQGDHSETIGEQDKLTPELKTRIEECYSSTQLEDITCPTNPGRRPGLP